MSDRDDRLSALRRARGERLDPARPDIVTRIHGSGRLTPRERLELLMDADSEVPYGTIAAADLKSTAAPWIAETGGLDALCSIDGQPAVVSTTDYSDSGGGYGAARIGRLLALAREHRWPVVMFVDGGGSRARHPRAGAGHLELSGAIGPHTVFDGMAELSGWVPTISVVSGPSFAGHASIAGFSDVVIATQGSAIGMGGPPMVEAAIGKRLTPQELSSAEMQLANGGIELLVKDEAAAVDAARRCLAYWPGHRPGATDPTHGDDGTHSVAARTDWQSPVPEAGPYDMTDVIEALVDEHSFLELRAPFAPAVVTGFARLGGRSVGVLATNPAHADGMIDEHGAQKIHRHVELCDGWELPIVALIDSQGTTTRWIEKDKSVSVEPGLSRMHLRCIVAHQSRQVPLLSVQLRHGRGLAPTLLTGYSTGVSVPPVVLGWHSVELNRADGFALVRDANAFDDIIEPAQTRERLLRLLRLLPAPGGRSAKRRPVDSW
jgi:acetyl-CoA carboxylase carboxyltransferase component